MEKQNLPEASIVVVPRERFSCYPECIERIYRNTRMPFELIAVNGDSSEKMSEYLHHQAKKQPNMKVVDAGRGFTPPGKSRNLGIAEASSEFVAVIDNDVFVREGWLEALVACMKETDAHVGVPMILVGESHIHAAGTNLLLKTDTAGKKFLVKKNLGYCGTPYSESLQLERRPTQYSESHAMMIRKSLWEKVGGFDEEIVEPLEIDWALRLITAGYDKAVLEPGSVVSYYPPGKIEFEDMKLHTMHWSPKVMKTSSERFYSRWQIDTNREHGWREFLLKNNRKIGILPRLFPFKPVFALDQGLKKLRPLQRKLDSIFAALSWKTYSMLSPERKEINYA